MIGDHTTLKAMVEAGLRRVLADAPGKAAPFHLRDARFQGEGLQPGVVGGRWDLVREAIYEGRGA